MSRLLTPLAACALCLAGPAAGQQTVPIDIPGLYDQIPAPPNTSTRFNLIGIQQAMLRTAAPLLDASRTATRNGAEWRQRYLTMDQRNR